MVFWPLASSSPMTSQESFCRRMRLPMGFCRPNNFVRTVSPMTQTAAPSRASLAVKARPSFMRRLLRGKYCSVVPVTVVAQFSLA